jgi:hypothetical protein
MPVLPFPWKLQATIRSRLGLPALSGIPEPRVAERSDPADLRGIGSRSRLRHEKMSFPTVQPKLLPTVDLVRALRSYRYDPHYRGENRVPIRALSQYVGLSHETVYQAMRGPPISERTRALLSWAIIAIGDGRLRFRRRGQAWEVQAQVLSLF